MAQDGDKKIQHNAKQRRERHIETQFDVRACKNKTGRDPITKKHNTRPLHKATRDFRRKTSKPKEKTTKTNTKTATTIDNDKKKKKKKQWQYIPTTKNRDEDQKKKRREA